MIIPFMMIPIVTAEMIRITDPMMVTIIIINHAHSSPFSNPYDTIRYMIPIITIKIPNIIGNIPRTAIFAAPEEPLLMIPKIGCLHKQ